jgi:DNA repair photolyase
VLGGDKLKFKAGLKDEKTAMRIFEKEMIQNKAELQKHGLFFSFTTDPLLPETVQMTSYAVQMCNDNQIPVKILSKRTDCLPSFNIDATFCEWNKSLIAIGFTLTGHDELEPFASSNDERILAMRNLKERGYRTFASIEPIIDLPTSLNMIDKSAEFCDLFKIGLLSGGKYDRDELRRFMMTTESLALSANIYFKDSLLKQASVERKDLPANCVTRDFNMFTN